MKCTTIKPNELNDYMKAKKLADEMSLIQIQIKAQEQNLKRLRDMEKEIYNEFISLGEIGEKYREEFLLNKL